MHASANSLAHDKFEKQAKNLHFFNKKRILKFVSEEASKQSVVRAGVMTQFIMQPQLLFWYLLC